MSDIKLYCGDCLDIMSQIEDKSIDLILCDLPYGTTACKWDNMLPLEDYIEIGKKKLAYKEYIFQGLEKGRKYTELCLQWGDENKKGLWSNYKRVLKESGVIVLFGQEPFSSIVRNSNLEWYRYDWVWQKEKPSNFQLMGYQPGRVHENIMVFSPKKACYTSNGNSIRYIPQMVERDKVRVSNVKIYGDINKNILNSYKKGEQDNIKTYDKKHPISIIKINNESHKVHPTQKPVELLEYLIRTYSKEGDAVLDNCMGSGSTGVACKNLNRKFIGIELDKKYFEIAKNRIFGLSEAENNESKNNI